MSRTEDGPMKRRWIRLVCWMIGTWVVTAVTLSLFWPIRPRLTLAANGALTVVGVSDDGKTLVTFTNRAFEFKDSDGNFGYTDRSSGPLCAWNVKTGTCRTICLPGQSCSDEYVKYGYDDRMLMKAHDGWYTDRQLCSFNGNWLLLKIGHGQEWTAEKQLVVNVLTGDMRVIADDSDSDFKLSPTGKWYAEVSRRGLSNVADGVTIVETATGRVQFRLDYQVHKKSVCFSVDDTYFACSSSNVKPGRSQIWDVAKGEVVQTIEEELSILEFAKRHRLIAGLIGSGSPSGNKPPKQEVRVWNVHSGTVVHSNKINYPARRYLFHYMRTLEFVDGDQWLVGSDLYNSYEGQPVVSARLNLRFSWNLKTNETVIHENDDDDFDPNISENGIAPNFVPRLFETFGYSETDPNLVIDPRQLFDITTRRSVYALPDEARTILLTRDGRRLVIEQEVVSGLGKFLSRVQNRGVPIPSFIGSLVSPPELRWRLIRIPSGWTFASIPAQQPIHWLSRNEKTLVTIANDDSGTINVWDFPLRPSLVQPFVGSLIAPTMIGICAWLRRLRKHPVRR